MKMTRLGLAALAAAFAAGAIAFGVVAQRGTANADEPNGNASRLQEILAQKLGISVDALVAAEKGARDQLVDELLAAGRITQAQADRMKSAEPGDMLGRGFGARMAGARVHVDVGQITADLSHIDLATLRSELQQGKSFAQVAQEHGVSRDALKKAITDAVTSQLKDQVSKGSLTQAQADEIAQRFAANLDDMIDHAHGVGGGFGPMRDRMPRPMMTQ